MSWFAIPITACRRISRHGHEFVTVADAQRGNDLLKTVGRQ